MDSNKDLLKLIEHTKEIDNVDVALDITPEDADWRQALRKKRNTKSKSDMLYESGLELTGKYSKESGDKLRGFLTSIGYKIPEVKITIDGEQIVDNSFKLNKEDLGKT